MTRLIKIKPSGFIFSYNKIQFQEYNPNVNSCGKWCYVFVKCVFKGLTLSEFQQKMKILKLTYNASYDDIVCDLWCSI